MRRRKLAESGSGIVQMLILLIILALAGLTAVRLLAGAVTARADCAGRQIISLDGAAGRCGEGIDLSSPPAQPAAGEPRAPSGPPRDRVAAPRDRVAAPRGRVAAPRGRGSITAPGARGRAAVRPSDRAADRAPPGGAGGARVTPVNFLASPRDEDPDGGEGDGSGNDFDPDSVIDLTDLLQPERRDNCLVGGGVGPVTVGGPLVQPEFVPGGGPRVSCDEQRQPELEGLPLIPDLTSRNRAGAPPVRGTKRVNERCSADSDCARGHCRNVDKQGTVCVDCSPETFAEIRGQQLAFCKGPRLSCKTLGPNATLELVDQRIADATRCVDSRRRIMNQCFGGGDARHGLAVTQAALVRTVCHCVRQALGNPNFDAKERSDRVRSCREIRGI